VVFANISGVSKKVFFGVERDTIETKATTWIHDIK